MFLHGGWMHLIGNMLFLWVFGRNVEDLIGGPRFLAFYLLGGIAAGIVHVIVNAYSRLPTIGASGAIAAVMGAYLIKFPRSKIVTLIFIFFFVTTAEIPAAFVLLYWFALQFISGVGSLASTDYTGGGVAWFAHIGGFLIGMLLIRAFPARQRWRAWYEED
jgi:membrane associated rhomboid family serine protease